MKTVSGTAEQQMEAAPQAPTRKPGIAPVLSDRFGFLLAKVQLGMRERAERALVPFGLRQGEVECAPKHVVCLLLIAGQGPMSQHALGEAIGFDRTTMVGIVDWLEAEGLVDRKRNPADRRAYALEITPKGRRWLKRADAALRDTERKYLAPLTMTERKQLIELLQRLLPAD
jgi:DNA-binding MarR family transcriptional regulator